MTHGRQFGPVARVETLDAALKRRRSRLRRLPMQLLSLVACAIASSAQRNGKHLLAAGVPDFGSHQRKMSSPRPARVRETELLDALKQNRTTARRREKRCKWWHAPVVVAGTGGSGTRGVVEALQEQDVFILGTDKKSCDRNSAFDTTCLNSCGHSNRQSIETYLDASARVAYEWLSFQDVPARCGKDDATKISASKALKGIPKKYRQRWKWGWKHPHLMYSVAELRSVFPCLHFIHTLRDPRDMAAVPREHLANRANEWTRIATALRSTERHTQTKEFDHHSAAAFLCANDTVCARIVRALPRKVPRAGRGQSTPEFESRVNTEPALELAVQCAMLMLWAFANELLVNWASSARGLPERGAYMPWVSEAAINNTNLRQDVLGVLRQDVLRLGDALRARKQRRRLAYGKWIQLINSSALTQLDHCGEWERVMGTAYYAV